jgi:hypothetical protein
MLVRASLPLETIALAVCILDSLDSKFALSWRLQCPLRVDAFRASSKRHTLSHSPLPDRLQPRQQQQMHIDSVNPEIIILAALGIAVKFVEDRQGATQYYCEAWGRGMWSCEQLNVTERCIMENLNYRILPLYDEELLIDAQVDMQLAARLQLRLPNHHGTRSENDETRGHRKGKSTGETVLGLSLGLQLTPAETPKSELSSFRSNVAFGTTSSVIEEDYNLHLPSGVGSEVKVAFEDAVLSR